MKDGAISAHLAVDSGPSRAEKATRPEKETQGNSKS